MNRVALVGLASVLMAVALARSVPAEDQPAEQRFDQTDGVLEQKLEAAGVPWSPGRR